MVNIVIPMAGLGSRFAKAGYAKPKPFIDVAGKPMIERVLENLPYPGARYILIAQREHIQREASFVKEIEAKYNAVFLPIDKFSIVVELTPTYVSSPTLLLPLMCTSGCMVTKSSRIQ